VSRSGLPGKYLGDRFPDHGCNHAVLAANPAFDVTPARLVRGIVTEHGVIAPVTRETIAEILSRQT